MINLLPEVGKTHVRREYLLRLISVGLLFLTFALFSLTLLLLPSLFLSEARKQALAEEFALLELSRAQRGDDTLAASLRATRETLEALEARIGEAPPSELIADMIRARPKGVVLIRFDYRTSGAARILQIQGEARDRDVLIAFRKNLLALPKASVELPVSNLAKSADIPFSLTLSMTPQ